MKRANPPRFRVFYFILAIGIIGFFVPVLANINTFIPSFGLSGFISSLDDNNPYIIQAAASDGDAGTWSVTGNLSTARSWHTATLLPNGKVLVAGGNTRTSGVNIRLSLAEAYDQVTGTWSNTGSMITARSGHTATLLNNGKVLVAGGRNETGMLNSAELYNPTTGTWSITGSLNTARTNHKATLLNNGKVLITGGQDSSNAYLNSAEIYDPQTGTWSVTGSLSLPRVGFTATLLTNGKVLVVGGSNGSVLLTSCELYDPVSGIWSATGGLGTARDYHTASVLLNGKVLVAGGYSGVRQDGLISAELYDPATGKWSSTGNMSFAHYFHTATLLPSGNVLVAGGTREGWDSTTKTELYDPATGTWSVTGNMVDARSFHTANLLPNGKVLVTGGEPILDVSIFLNSAEVYTPSNSAGSKTDQTITFGAISNKTYGEADFIISATASSGLAVTFTASGACTVSGNSVHLTRAGNATITARQAGDSSFNPAADVSQSFTVSKGSPAFSNLSSPTINVGMASTTLGGNIKSGNLAPTGSVLITLSGVTLSAPISGTGDFSSSFVTGNLTAGTYPLNYSYDGDTNFNSLTDNSKNLTVSLSGAKTTPVIIWNNPADIPAGTALGPAQLNATANIAGTFSYSPPAGTVLSVGSQTLSVTFTPTDTANYNSTTKSVTINVLSATTPQPPAPPPNNPPVAIGSGGSGGGGGSIGGPVITVVNTVGLTSSTILNVDINGKTQQAVQLKTEDGTASLEIPASTQLQDANGKALNNLSCQPLASVTSLPPNNVLVLAYEFGPEGAKFNPPLTLTLKYDPQALPTGADKNTLSLTHWDGSKWTTLEAILDSLAGTAKFKTDHVGQYILMVNVPPSPANFIVSDFQVKPLDVNADDPVTLQLTVSNTGGSPGNYSATLKVNGAVVDSQSIAVDAGKTESLTFHVQRNVPGDYSVEVNGKTAKFTVKAPPQEPTTITSIPQATSSVITPSEPAVTSSTLTATPSRAPTAGVPTASGSPSVEEAGAFPVRWVVIAMLIVIVLGTAIGLVFDNRRRHR